MNQRSNGLSSAQRSKSFQREGPNWVLIAGGALLSTLSIRLGFKLKQVLDSEESEKICNGLKAKPGNGKPTDRKKSGSCHLHSNGYCFAQDEDACFNYLSSATQGLEEVKQESDGQLLEEREMALSLVTVPATEFNKENGITWSSSADRLELHQKPFHHSNSSDSPCVSEYGSDIFSKREVIQKLRQQLKRRDDMILEMQEQIVELQNSLRSQLSHSSHLQSLLDVASQDLLNSEREIQRLRKAIADHCVGQVDRNYKPLAVPIWPSEETNGHTNGYLNNERSLESSSEKGGGERHRIVTLKREVDELKEVIEGKEYLLQNYKEQKAELSTKVKELQLKLDSQLPNIL